MENAHQRGGAPGADTTRVVGIAPATAAPRDAKGSATRPAAASTPLLGLIAVGLGALFSSLFIYSGVAISFLRFPGLAGHMGTFAETLLLTATIVAGIAAFLAARRTPLPFTPLAVGAGIAYGGCGLIMAFVCYFNAGSSAIFRLLGIATALASVGIILLWGRICAQQLSARRAFIVVALAGALSAALCWLYNILPLEGTIGVFLGATLTATVVPLALHGGNGLQEEDDPEKTASETREENGEASRTASAGSAKCKKRASGAPAAGRSSWGSLAAVTLTPGLGLVAFALVMAVMRTEFAHGHGTYLAMLALAGIGIALYALLKKSRFLLPGSLQQIFLPVMALALLAMNSVASTLQWGDGAVTVLTYGLYSLAAIITLATLCAIAHAGEFSADLIFASAIFVFCGASFLGQTVAGFLIDGMINVAVTLITTAYAFALVLISYGQTRREMHWEEKGAGNLEAQGDSPAFSGLPASAASTNEPTETGREKDASAVPPTAEERCAQLAREFELTRRETEILSYLAEGHNGSYIASALFISPNTARTHIHNIYRKLGVSSREDILRLAR